jgi:cholesterol transport system auxiliary component
MNKIIFLGLFSLLIGCMGTNNPPADIYTISPEWSNKSLQFEGEKKSSLIIKLSPIRAAQEFIGNEIIYTDSLYSRNGYAYSRWNDAPVKLLQTLFQINIEKSNLFKAIIPSASVSKADLLLESSLLDFSHHINDDGASEGVIRVRFYLIDNTIKTVIATKQFVSRVPAPTKNARGAVEALNTAATFVARDLVTWLAESR